MWTSDKRAKLSLKVQQDLAERSKQGVWAHPLCVVLVAVTTGLLHRAPVLMWTTICCSIAQAVLRGKLIHRLQQANRSRSRRLEIMHIAVLLSCACTWGIAVGIALQRFGAHDRDVLVLLLYHAVVAFGTVNLFVHERRLIVAAMVFLLGPPLLGHLLSGQSHLVDYMSAAVVYFVYCLVQGKKLNQLYEQQISDNYEMSVAAYRDCLTGLPNRLYMNHLIEDCMGGAGEKRRQIALLYIDLDGFKQINDRHSHRVGDLFLCEAATRISGCLREGDVVARIGGDEFTVLLPDCASEREAVGIANRVLRAAREPLTVDGHRLRYSTSIGVSLFPDMAADAELLVRTADEAMYAAKISGKDRVCIAPPTAGVLPAPVDYEVPVLTFCSTGGMGDGPTTPAPLMC